MFDVFIIERIRDEEERRRRESERPRLEIPTPDFSEEEPRGRDEGESPERGVLIIERDEE